jgi:hypothetical protein
VIRYGQKRHGGADYGRCFSPAMSSTTAAGEFAGVADIAAAAESWTIIRARTRPPDRRRTTGSAEPFLKPA